MSDWQHWAAHTSALAFTTLTRDSWKLAHGILSLLHSISPVVIKQTAFSHDKSPFPDPRSSLQKAILKTSKVGLCTYFFSPLSTCSHQDQQRLRALKMPQTRPDQKPHTTNDTPVLLKTASVGICPVERDVLQNVFSEGNAKSRAQPGLVYAPDLAWTLPWDWWQRDKGAHSKSVEKEADAWVASQKVSETPLRKGIKCLLTFLPYRHW